MNRKVPLGILSILSLAISTNIYTDLRGYEHGLFKWGNIIFPLDLSLMGHTLSSNSFLLYNLPDGLWMLSFCLILIIIWGNTSKSSVFTWLSIGFGIGILFEVFQHFGKVSGTFDNMDVVCITMAFLLSLTTLFTLNNQL